ncbi:MAG TPA: OmpA family protein [Bacteroidia bacterium]|nr:OmpA family protein [Bacteroidia bacterium]
MIIDNIYCIFLTVWDYKDMVKGNYLLFAILFLTNVNAFSQPDASLVTFDSINPRIGAQIRLPVIHAFGCNSFRNDKIIYRETAGFINKYPSVIFQIESHTDCRASADYNRDLSLRRADSARRYILSGLTDTSQLPLAVGVGEDDLLLKKCSCNLSDHTNICTEWEHQQNRRTILRVIGFKKGYSDSLSLRVKAHAEGILNNKIAPHDDLLTSACLDSLASLNSVIRDYYFKIVAVIAGKSDGALSESVSVHLKSYLANYPEEFLRNYELIKTEQQDNILYFIAFEFYLEAEEDSVRYDISVDKYFTSLANNCYNCKKHKKTIKRVKIKLLEKY